MKNKYIGITFLIVGVALAIWGYDFYNSAGSQVTRALNGDTPLEAWLGMIGGAICIAVGTLKIK